MRSRLGSGVSAVGLLVVFVACATALHACDQPGTSASGVALQVPSLCLTPTFTEQFVPGGSLVTIVATAMQGGDASTCPSQGGATLQGLTVTFSTTTAGVTIAPSSSVTNASGQATATVVVPFGTQVAVVAAAGGAEATLLVPGSGEGAPIVFDTPTFVASSPAAYLPVGQVFTFQTTARTAPDAGGVAGLTVAFATTTTGVSFSPASFTTGESGAVESSVVIPYGTTVEAVVSGGGGDQTAFATAAALKLTPGPFTPITSATYLPGGEVYALQATARAADGGPPVEGVSVAFTTTTTGVTFSPASAPTNAQGVATSNVVLPYGAEVQAVVAGGGDVEAATASGPTISLHATSSLSSPLELLPTGEVFGITASAAMGGGPADAGVAIEGLSVAFATTTTGIAFTPSSLATNASGFAAANVVVPYGAQVQAVVSGGGAAYALPSLLSAPAVSLTPRFVPQGADAGTCVPGMACVLQVRATVGTVGVQGLPLSIVITDLQTRIADGGPGSAGTPTSSSIAAPTGIVTDDTGTAEFALAVPGNIVELTAVVAGGGANQSAQWP